MGLLLHCVGFAAVAQALVPRAATQARNVVQKAVWSDSRAVKDYQDLLAGTAPRRLEDGPALVIGSDSMAKAFAELAPASPDAVLGVADAIPLMLDATRYPALTEAQRSVFPIYVFCDADELEPLLQACPAEKKDDLVFMHYRGQMVEPVLRRYGCFRDTQSQVVLYYAVNEFGKVDDDRTCMGNDAMGREKWAAESCATGKWAGAVADRMVRANLHCSELFQRDWRRHMFERCVFEAAYGLVGAVHKKVPISEVHEYFPDEVDDMLYEIQRALRGHLALTLLNGVEERMAAYSKTQRRSKKDDRAAVVFAKDTWKNTFFYDISVKALAQNFPDPSPMHTAYWELAKNEGVLD
ncbi:hypothetical protein M885DRAFT_510406 [Pelagophyceae sp. CCMP2097]|nr:hypothetical protein M885DRAFT_510406 [Pelagophyceae sp. CCMP2097]